MSYDIYFKKAPCKECGHAEGAGIAHDSPTYNFAPLFVALFNHPDGLRMLDGKTGRATLAQLRDALTSINDRSRQEEFWKICEPNNGWGTPSGARDCLHEWSHLAEQYPDYVWEIR